MKSKNLFYILSFTSGILFLILIFVNLQTAFVFAIAYLIFNFLAYKKLFHIFLSIILFPFYPVISFMQEKKILGSYIEEDFENSLELYSFQLKEDTVNAAPFFATLSYGTLEQKRNLPYLLYKLYINNFVEENVVFYMLNSLMRENPHPDILLAATDALTLIETHIIEKLEESLQSSNALENIVNFTIYSLKYIKSGFLFGEQKEEFIKKTLNSSKFNVIIKEKLTNLISEKVKIPFIPIENFISGLLDNFLEDVVRDFNSKGATYYEIQNFIELHLSNLKIGDVVTFEQFDKFIHNFIERVEISKIVNYLKEKFDDQELEKIIYILLDKLLCKEINISKILETFSIDLKVILKFLIVKYQRQIIDSIESFLKKISFSKIVKEKIESYSVEEMEEVTLKVAKKELRYVEIFGIPLGMLISVFQLIF